MKTENNNLHCVSCKVDLTNMAGSVVFDCPACDKSKIIRCNNCRNNAIKYKCSECGFEGPN
ncbi:RNA-binding protein [Candidatus Woesearchaeota archaeon]|nr:RNA-binding protein [Candidatus Woesearchaeota archaeon]